jgi:hypothetical protein
MRNEKKTIITKLLLLAQTISAQCSERNERKDQTMFNSKYLFWAFALAQLTISPGALASSTNGDDVNNQRIESLQSNLVKIPQMKPLLAELVNQQSENEKITRKDLGPSGQCSGFENGVEWVTKFSCRKNYPYCNFRAIVFAKCISLAPKAPDSGGYSLEISGYITYSNSLDTETKIDGRNLKITDHNLQYGGGG